MGKTENIELRVKGKEIHDNHIGALKLFGAMNEILIEQSKESSKFNYRKCLGDTVYKSKNTTNNNSIIKIKGITFLSRIKENDLFESLNLVLELKRDNALTDEIALNQLLFMSGINSVFSNLLHTASPKEKIQAVADILVFYHTCLLKGRDVIGNTYTLKTPSDIKCVITCVEPFVFDIYMARTIDYASVVDISVEVPEPVAKPKFSIGGLLGKGSSAKEKDIWESTSLKKNNKFPEELKEIRENKKKETPKKIAFSGVTPGKKSLQNTLDDIQSSVVEEPVVMPKPVEQPVEKVKEEELTYKPINVPETPDFKVEEHKEKAFASMDSPKEKVMNHVAKSIEAQKNAIKEDKAKVEETLDDQIAAIKARRAQEDAGRTMDLSSLKNYLDSDDMTSDAYLEPESSDINLSDYII